MDLLPPPSPPFLLPPAPTSADHPPYPEMIRTAIATLNDRNGSTKKAISKFIEQAYPHLPSTHPDLLTQHLNLLKTSDLLVMVNKSYKLPQFDASPSAAKRKRGRPPKRKPDADPQPQPQPDVLQNANPQATRRGPGRPPKVRMNIADQPGSSARRGHPPKPKSEPAFSNGTKRRPGRPPKNQTNIKIIPSPAPGPAVPAKTATASMDTGLSSISPRGRGRPTKNAAAVPPSAAAPQAAGFLSRVSPPNVAGLMRPKDPVRRPVRRPKKGTSVEELRRKLEYFQLKVNECIGVIMPYFNTASPVSAIAAIQELERLAAMDLNAPLQSPARQPQASGSRSENT